MDPTNSKAVAGLIAMGHSLNSTVTVTHNEAAADICYTSTTSASTSATASGGGGGGGGSGTGLMGSAGGDGGSEETADYVRFDDHVVIARSVPSSIDVESESETLWSDVEIEVNTS